MSAPVATSRALITGASSGIGRSLALRMAKRGVHVWLAARRKELLDAVVADIRAAGGIAHAVVVDVGDAKVAYDAIAALDADVGGFDVVVANAGVGGKGVPVSQLGWDDLARVFQVDLMGALATLMAVVPRMKRDGKGQLVAVSSLASEIALPIAADYAAAKAGLSFFLTAAQTELPRHGIDVTIVHPGFIRTDMTAKNKFPMPFLMEVDAAAAALDAGIMRRDRLVRFPFGLAALLTLARWLPDVVVQFLARKAVPGRA